MNDTQALTGYRFTIDAAVAEWLAQKETIGSKRTRAEYEETMYLFRALLDQGGLDLLSNPIDIARIAALWANMRAPNTRRPGQDVSPAMYNQRLAILSSWYTFVQETYHLEVSNPIKGMKRRKVQPYAGADPIPPHEVEQGLAGIDRSTQEGIRDYALLAVALYTGRRASELADLRGRDVRIQGRGKETRIRLVFHAKGDKVKKDLLPTETSAVLLDYLHVRFGKQLQAIPPDAPIWISYSRNASRGQAISIRTLSNIVAAHLPTSKVHALRHSFVVGMLRSGAPLTDVADHLGHTDIKITRLYAKELTGDENRYGEALEKRFGIKRKSRKG
jgi:integrase